MRQRRYVGNVIRAAVEKDVPTIREIERAAGVLFNEAGMRLVGEMEPTSLDDLRRFAREGRAWVFVDADDRPIAFVLADAVDGRGHVDQVSVHPSRAHQGIGRQLIDRTDAWGAAQGLSDLTLTTYVEVPWNGPYYERLGFRYIPDDELTDELRAIREKETALGLDRWPRAAMIRPRA